MKDYHNSHLVPYDQPEGRGYLSLEVLPYLKGKKWDEIALAYVHSLRPSSIRVTRGEVTADARQWRVTVTVDAQDVIQKITQESEVGLPEGIAHGMALQAALKYGIDSPQCKWWVGAECVTYGFGGLFKSLADGTLEDYPTPTAE